jgi:DNA-directed RNA polymerase subunit RPC12/RpoP
MKPKTVAESMREAIGGDLMPPTNALHVLREILADVSTLNQRRCWSCGQSHWHAAQSMPYVKCPECGSQDTRIIMVQAMTDEEFLNRHTGRNP